MTTPQPAPRLDYAQAQSLVTRIGRRRIVLAAILFAIAIAAILWTKPAIRRVQQWNRDQQFQRLQRRALAYTAPADRIVYEEDPGEAAGLLKQNGFYASIPTFDAQGRAATRLGWQPPVRWNDSLWSAFASGPLPLAVDPRAPAFLGERTTRSGERRLVCVGVAVEARQDTGGRWGINRWLQAWSFEPGTLDHPDATAPMGQMIIDSDAPRAPGSMDPLSDDLANPFTPPFPLRLYAGQRDPTDASRFTIAYELQGRRGVITGILQDDGSVLFKPDIGWHGRLDTTITWIPRFTPQHPQGE
jgi:hypothetical protein